MGKSHPFRPTLLLLALIGGGMIFGLSFAFDGPRVELLVPVAAALIGGVAATMRDLVAPEPNPEVPSSTAMSILGALAGSSQPALDDPGTGKPAIRWNVLMLCLGAAIVVLVVAFLFGDKHPVAVLGVAGAFIGGLCTIARDLTQPDPDPAVPASVVTDAIEAIVETRGNPEAA